MVNGLTFLLVDPAFPLASKELKGPPCLLLMTYSVPQNQWLSSLELLYNNGHATQRNSR
jgi:hypothetical protein